MAKVSLKKYFHIFKLVFFQICLMLVIFLSSCNPFAPGYDDEGLTDEDILGDRTTLDGLFRYFKNSYELKDTSLYGKLFSPDFTFVYYDFDQASEVSWDIGQEMAISYNLFKNVRQISLDWNFYLQKEENDSLASVVRTFNLSIIQDENNIYTGTGRARLNLKRDNITLPWQIYYWFDDSDF